MWQMWICWSKGWTNWYKLGCKSQQQNKKIGILSAFKCLEQLKPGTSLSDEQCSFEWRKTYFPICTPSAVIRSLISRLSDHLFFSEFLHTPIINDANRKHLVLTNLSNNWYVHKFSNHIYIPCISQKPSKALRKGFPYNKCWLYIVSKERLNKC